MNVSSLGVISVVDDTDSPKRVFVDEVQPAGT